MVRRYSEFFSEFTKSLIKKIICYFGWRLIKLGNKPTLIKEDIALLKQYQKFESLIDGCDVSEGVVEGSEGEAVENDKSKSTKKYHIFRNN